MNIPNKFKAMAQESTTFSKIMVDREKLKTQEIMKKYPNGVTLTEVDIVTMFDIKKKEEVTFAVFAIKENEKECFFGGKVLTKIALEWVESCGGDVTETSEQLKKCGGVKVKMESSETKGGNNLTRVTIID